VEMIFTSSTRARDSGESKGNRPANTGSWRDGGNRRH
jgi:hypothetical protein